MALKTNYYDNDYELIMQINENNEEAKDHLFEKYSALIHKEINQIWKEANAKGIEYNDLVQEAMMAFSEAINNYNESENVKFITFATLCIKRKLINMIKKYSTQKSIMQNNQIHLDNIKEGFNTTLTANISDIKGKEPLNKVITNESLKEINNIFSKKLSDNEKKAFMFMLNGESTENIAKIMNISTKQVYNLIYRARQKLKLK
jgi:RNA polymerase sporulation-specific sigma factor